LPDGGTDFLFYELVWGVGSGKLEVGSSCDRRLCICGKAWECPIKCVSM